MGRRKDNQDMYALLGERMLAIQGRIQDTKQERINEIVASVNVQNELAELEMYRNLNNKDRLDYMYKVKPYFKDIAELIENGFKMTGIAKVLDVPYKSLERMRKEIPELNELFSVSELAVIESVETSLELLTRPRVVWEEKVNTLTGEVETLERIVDPSLPAIKFFLEHQNQSKDKYKNEKTVTHSMTISPEFEKLLQSMSTEELKTLNNDVSDAIDAEFTEVD